MRRRIILAVQAILAIAVIVTGLVMLPSRAAASPISLADSAVAVKSTASFVSSDIVVKPKYQAHLSSTYRVENGDTLAKIATGYGLTWTQLYCYNKNVIGSNPDILAVGEKIAIGSAKCIIKQPVVVRLAQNTSNNQTSTTAQQPQAPPTSNPPATQPSGSLQAYALQLLGGNQTQFACLDGVINIESSWNVYAYNPSGAYGIPQALPGSKMSVAGPDWQSNGYTQLRWMIDFYIPPTYGTACGAYSHELADGWY